jgi:hypothetical protein
MYRRWMIPSMVWIVLMPAVQTVRAQDASQAAVPAQIEHLTSAIARTQSQLDESQRELDEMRKELAELKGQMATNGTDTSAATLTQDSSSAADATAAAVDDLRERETVSESKIATHEQDKVESESKYPVRITGLLLLNGFVNTRAVNAASTPTVAVPGAGSTGASARQTVLGIDARGPHLLGASSHADLRVDFAGNVQPGGATYGSNQALLRLRTMHAALDWSQTEAYFSLDRPIITPDTPTSLTAVSEPALAWSGNLWTWNPQVGIRQNLRLSSTRDLSLEAALIDVADAPLSPSAIVAASSTPTIASSGEESRWPGVEARVALLGTGADEQRNHIGIGGFFAPHRSSTGNNFDAWAATLDARFFLPAHLQFTGSAYRGLALGGLGGGAYKDFAYKESPASGQYYFLPLDDAGGWAELKERFSERFEANVAFGTDNAFAYELRRYAAVDGSFYQNLARNHTYTGNVIYSPSAYLLFSLEYRHIESAPILGPAAGSNIIGLGAGYKF